MGILGFGQPNIVGLISHASSTPGGSIRGGIESKTSLIGLRNKGDTWERGLRGKGDRFIFPALMF